MFLFSSSPWPCLLLNSLYTHQEAIVVIKSTYILLSDSGQVLFGCFHVCLSLPLTKDLRRLGIMPAWKFSTVIPACISSSLFLSLPPYQDQRLEKEVLGKMGRGDDGPMPETNQRSGCHADSMRKGFQAIGRGWAQTERMQGGQRSGSELGGTDFTKFRYCFFFQPFPHLSLHFLMLFFFFFGKPISRGKCH